MRQTGIRPSVCGIANNLNQKVKINYNVPFVIYSMILIGQLLFVLIWSLGMKENAELGVGLIIMIWIVILTILSLSLFLYLTKKAKSLKFLVGLISLLLVIGTLTYGLYHLLNFDLNAFLIIVMALFSISGIILITKIGKEVFK